MPDAPTPPSVRLWRSINLPRPQSVRKVPRVWRIQNLVLPKSWSGITHVLASLDEQTQKQQPARSLTDVGTFLAGGAAALLPGEGNEARSRALKMKRSVGPPGLSRAASRGEAFSSKCMGDLHKSLYTLRPSSWAAELPGDSFSSCTYATRLCLSPTSACCNASLPCAPQHSLH